MPRLSRALTQILSRPLRLPPPSSSFPARPLSPITRLSPSSRPLFYPLAIPSLLPPPPILFSFLQVRAVQRGTEYQPSQRKRKRKHGFLARKRSLGGRKILRRRMAKGRRYPTH